jgi:hypothetical protein
LRSKKAPGHDLITGRIVKELPDIGMRAITHIFDSVLRTGYFPGQWKVSQIITILKPGKQTEEVTSYKPISLLPILSKLFEKLFLTRIKPIQHEKRVIPDHQFCVHQFVHREAIFKNVPTKWHFLYSILFPENSSTCFG